MGEITAEAVASALAEPTIHLRSYLTCVFVVTHGGIDGYERNMQLAQFMTRLRTAALVAAHKTGWPHPTSVTKAEVSIVAHGTRCGPKTMVQMATFFAKHLYAGPHAVSMATPAIVKTGTPRLEVTVRAIEIMQPENLAERAARLAREAAPPSIRADGTIENELRDWETPAFIMDQGVADIDPLDDRLDRMESAVQIPKPEDDIDPPSVIAAEDPDAVVKRWHPLLAHDTPGTGGSSNGKSRKPRPKAADSLGRHVFITTYDGPPRVEHIQGKVSEEVKTVMVDQNESVGEIIEDIGRKMIRSGMSFAELSKLLGKVIDMADEQHDEAA